MKNPISVCRIIASVFGIEGLEEQDVGWCIIKEPATHLCDSRLPADFKQLTERPAHREFPRRPGWLRSALFVALSAEENAVLSLALLFELQKEKERKSGRPTV